MVFEAIIESPEVTKEVLEMVKARSSNRAVKTAADEALKNL
jgi:hypothetical protein